MKSIFSIGLLLSILLMPNLGLVAYLMAIGDYDVIQGIAAVFSLPGNIVISILSA